MNSIRALASHLRYRYLLETFAADSARGHPLLRRMGAAAPRLAGKRGDFRRRVRLSHGRGRRGRAQPIRW